MLLVLDVGNSQTSFGVYENDKLVHHFRAETKSSRTAEEYAAFLWPLLQLQKKDFSGWAGVAIASVVPLVNQPLKQFCRDYLKREPFFVEGKNSFGFSLGVDHPEEVGADRLANAAFAVTMLKLPAVVVDIGTTTNFDVVNVGAVYEGGAILPGVRMGLESLGMKTAKLPIIDLEFPTKAIGKNTVECIRVGVLLGYCDLIDGLLNRMTRELGQPTEVVLTGGMGGLLQPHLKTASRWLPNLTLDGVVTIFQKNAKR